MQDKNQKGERIDRREFLQKASAGAVALSITDLPSTLLKTTAMGVVVHSYASRWNSKAESKKYPGFSNAIEMMEHCHSIGAGGVQVLVRDWDKDFAARVRSTREKLGLYVEGSIALPKSAQDVAAFEKEVISSKEAGAGVLRAVCLSGRRYETFHTATEFNEFRKNSIASLQLAEPVVRKHQVKLAIENHKDWRASELIDILKQIDSEWLGVTLDFGNSISLLEDPMEVVRTLAPRAFSTHVKDMGVAEYEDGFLLSEVPLGQGFLELKEIIDICRKYNPAITFNLEMITRDPLKIPCLQDEYWEVFEGVNGRELARTLRTVRERKYESDLPTVSQLTDEGRLAVEEQNILDSFAYSRDRLGLR
jgi:sugar phosphate isomerase/epimerase